jgi:D-alanyl-D-alanine carboxypeptidase/D-alanyl-D-alanine-endopeptidase (penicillin-binding protein 4)
MPVTVEPGLAQGSPTTLTVDPEAAERPLINRTITGARDSQLLVWPEQRPGETSLTIAGTIPSGAEPARLVVSAGNPTLWFANALRERLIRGGIEVTGVAVDIDDVRPTPNRGTATVLYTHKSRPLSAIVQPLLKDSINLYGEAVLRLNAGRDVFPTNDAALDGLRKKMSGWGIPAEAQQLIDGSGLSRRDVIAPEAVLTVLRRMYDPSGKSPFMTALPIAGVDGSLSTRMKGTPAEGNVRAKTGTMSNVRSLAGYVTTRDGERLAFVIIVNNFEGSGAEANAALDAIAIRLASFSRRG